MIVFWQCYVYQYTDLVEALSLDEAYLDVTNNKKGIPSATLIAEEIRTKIYELTGLTASAGISINKFLAKVASDYNKPNGQKTIPPEEVINFLSDLDVRKFHGVGKITAEKMYRKGLYTGADLRNQSLSNLEKYFGKSGQFYYDVVRGIHLSPVRPQRKPKSVGAERTFDKNISSEIFMVSRLEDIASALEQRLLKTKISGKTITLKIKYSDFDALVIIADATFESANTLAKLCQELNQLSQHFYQYDPLQHHGWFVLTEKRRRQQKIQGIRKSKLYTTTAGRQSETQCLHVFARPLVSTISSLFAEGEGIHQPPRLGRGGCCM